MISFPIALPSLPQARVLTWTAESASAATVSPFTGSSQVQGFQNDRLTPTIELPGGLARSDVAPFVGALNAMRGGQGACFFGEYAGRIPLGAAKNYAAGAIVPAIYDPATALQAGSRVLPMGGWPASIANLLTEGDWLQVGAGWNGSRLSTAGGSNVAKYQFVVAAPSVNGQKYLTRVRVRNVSATKTVMVSDGIGGGQNVAPGVETLVSLISTGDGVNALQLLFQALAAGDSLDFIAWDPSVGRYGIDENLLLAGADLATGWTPFGGAAVTVLPNQNQRIYQVTAPCNSDAGGVAIADVFPRLREAPAAGFPVVWLNTAGVFRVLPDSNGGTTWTIDEAMQYGLKFQLTEAY